MAPERFAVSMLRPEDVTGARLPLAVRGYDREKVDRLLARAADAYALALKQSDVLLERVRSLEAALAAAEGEAAASARSVAELMRAAPPPAGQPPPSRKALRELEARLGRSESEREQAVADLRAMSSHAAELEARLHALEREEQERARRRLEAAERVGEAETVEAAGTVGPAPAQDEEAALLLVAAARAADDVRTASRARALRTLTRARERAAQLDAETEGARAALAEAQQRCEAARQEAEDVLARARGEAEQAATAIAEERHRVREVLAETLASLDVSAPPPGEDLMGDLQSRLPEPTDTTVA